MSALDAVLKTTNNNSSINLAIIVEEWEDNQVKGILINTHEQAVIRLNEFEKKENAKFDRPTLKSIKEKKRAKKGAVLFFESCVFSETDGVWYSRWANLIKKSTEDTKNIGAILKAKVVIGKVKKTGNEYVSIHTLIAKRGKIPYKDIKNIDDLKNIASNHLISMGNGITPFILVYAEDKEKNFPFEIKASYIETTAENGEKKFIIDPSFNNSIDNYISSQWGEKLLACIEHPDISLKAVLGKIIYCGSATKDAMLNSTKGEFMKNEFKINKDESYCPSNLGYKDVFIGIRDDQELDSKYSVFVSSISPYAEPETISDLIK